MSIPEISQAAFIAPGAAIYGNVVLAEGTSVWFNAVIRAESASVEIGAFSNIQDHAMIHIGTVDATRIGAYCSITHHATVHGATVGDHCLIGIGATVMDGAIVGDNCIVAGHCIVTEGAVVPPDSIVAGVPGKVVARRNNYVDNKVNAYSYYRNALAYVQGDHRLWSREDYQAELSAARARYEQDPEAASE